MEVGVITIATQPVTLTQDLPGRISAFRVAEVRARVSGIVLKRLFKEGSDVKEGQVLYEIDPAQYEASLDSAQGTLATQTQDQVQSVSGVNLDEEAANLIRYQQAYQAAGKALEVANTMFDALLQIQR